MNGETDGAVFVPFDDLARATELIATGGQGIINGVALLLEARYRYEQEDLNNGSDCSKVLHSTLKYLSDEPYIVLNLTNDAENASIKKAYRKLALKYHPDKNPSTPLLFQEVQGAYDLLSDEDKKERYDERKRAQQQVMGRRKSATSTTQPARNTWAQPRSVPKPTELRMSDQTDNSVTIEWNYSDPSGMSAAFHFQWRRRDLQSAQWETAKNPVLGTSVRKKNLDPHQYYEFRVRATSAAGTSAWSEALLVFISNKPPARAGRGPRRGSVEMPSPPRAAAPTPTPPPGGGGGGGAARPSSTGYTSRRQATSNIRRQGGDARGGGAAGGGGGKHQFHWVRLITLGDMGVGKSCLLHRYCSNQFRAKYIPTCGVDTLVKGVSLAGLEKDVRVSFWDLSGHEEFAGIRNEFYNDAQGVVLVFDLTSAPSFQNLERWVREASEYASLADLPVVVCGNKADAAAARRAVREGEGRTWALRRGYRYFETSAMEGRGVRRALDNVVEAAALG